MDAREYYSRQDIVQKLLELGKSREVVGVFKDGSYSKRPNTIVYPADVEAMVRTGIVEFHNSIELWSNPLQIKSNYEDLRVGWDMVRSEEHTSELQSQFHLVCRLLLEK